MFRRNFAHSFTQTRGLCRAVGMGWISSTPAPRAAPEPPSPAPVTMCPAAGWANTHRVYVPRCTWHTWMQCCQRPFGRSTPAGTPGPLMPPTAVQHPESPAGPHTAPSPPKSLLLQVGSGKRAPGISVSHPHHEAGGVLTALQRIMLAWVGKEQFMKQQAPHKNSLPYT